MQSNGLQINYQIRINPRRSDISPIVQVVEVNLGPKCIQLPVVIDIRRLAGYRINETELVGNSQNIIAVSRDLPKETSWEKPTYRDFGYRTKWLCFASQVKVINELD